MLRRSLPPNNPFRPAADFYDTDIPPAPPGMTWWKYKDDVPPLPTPEEALNNASYARCARAWLYEHSSLCCLPPRKPSTTPATPGVRNVVVLDSAAPFADTLQPAASPAALGQQAAHTWYVGKL